MQSPSSTLSRPTLAGVLVPGRGQVRAAGLVVAFSLINALAAQLSFHLPWTPVPVTGQTFAVLLTGAALGPRLGFAALVLYLAEGAAGLPVFAGGAGGPAALLSPSAGYLYAFPFGAAAVGWLATRGWDRHPLWMGAAMVAGNAVIYAGGLPWLAGWLATAGQFPGVAGVLAMGLTPFLMGDALKAVAAMALLPGTWRLVRRRE